MDYCEWDGTEQGLERLLIWWGTRIPWEHSPNCTESNVTMHCCAGVYDYESEAGIEGSSHGFRLDEPIALYFRGSRDAEPVDVEIGDKIVYEGEGKFRLEQA